jgi:hypothetical protein
MKTMEEKAAEVVTRWQELHLDTGGAPPLKCSDYNWSDYNIGKFKGMVLSPCPACGSFNTSYSQPGVYARCRDCKAWWADEDEARKGQYRTEGKTIDWARLLLIIEGMQRKNNNPILAKLKPPAIWIQDIAVGEMEEWSGWWAVVEPKDWCSFCSKDGKENAIKLANKLIELREKK